MIPRVAELTDAESFLRRTIDRLNSPFDDRLLQFAHNTQSLNGSLSGDSNSAILSNGELGAPSIVHTSGTASASSDPEYDSQLVQSRCIVLGHQGLHNEVQGPKPEHDIIPPLKPVGEIGISEMAPVTCDASDSPHELPQDSLENQASIMGKLPLDDGRPNDISDSVFERHVVEDLRPWPPLSSESFSTNHTRQVDKGTAPATLNLNLGSKVLPETPHDGIQKILLRVLLSLTKVGLTIMWEMRPLHVQMTRILVTKRF